ncbi:MAG: hypothetical protein RLO23_02855, partial [Alphaproteobacteria bacterium]
MGSRSIADLLRGRRCSCDAQRHRVERDPRSQQGPAFKSRDLAVQVARSARSSSRSPRSGPSDPGVQVRAILAFKSARDP